MIYFCSHIIISYNTAKLYLWAINLFPVIQLLSHDFFLNALFTIRLFTISFPGATASQP